MSQLSIYCSSLTNIIWNYSECGHGKGAPDGVGALLKRTADRLVAHDGDMNNIDSFVNYLKSAVQGVKISTVEEYEVEEKDWKKEDECIKYVVKCPHGKHLDFHNLSTDRRINPQLATPSIKRSITKSKIDRTKMRPVKLSDKLILFPQPSYSKNSTLSMTPKISKPADLKSFSSTKLTENLLFNYADLNQSTPSCSFFKNIDSNILVDLEESSQLVNKEETVNVSESVSNPNVEERDTDEEIFSIRSKIKFKNEKNEPRAQISNTKQRFNYVFGGSDTDDDLF